MIVMKGCLIDSKDLNERNFKKDYDLKLIICFDFMSKLGGALMNFLIDLTYKILI